VVRRSFCDVGASLSRFLHDLIALAKGPSAHIVPDACSQGTSIMNPTIVLRELDILSSDIIFIFPGTVQE
jgi:hypothetical protein